jgi:hypothetical protein
MSQLTLASINGIFDLADAAIAGDQLLTDDSIQKISHNAKFGAVRCEIIYMGFYAHGNTVPVPASPVDGYAYSPSELSFFWIRFSNRAPGEGFVPGQAERPVQADSKSGSLYNVRDDINDVTRVVDIHTTYWANGTETPTNDGILKVYALCQRASVNVAN